MRMSKQKKGLVPELRFPEFLSNSGWEAVYGNKAFEQISNKDHNSDLPILAITQEYGAIPREMIDYNVSVTEKSVQSYKVVDVGDFIISLRSFQGGIEYSEYRGLCSPAYVILRNKKGIEKRFFKQYFKAQSFIRDLTKNLEGLRDGKMISYKQFSEVLLPKPSPEEQQRVANFLASIDELITLHTQKSDALKAYKKGLMRQLFPAEGETEPKIRFPEFSNAGPWRLKSVGSVFIEKQRPINMKDDVEYSLVTVKRRYGGLVSRGVYKGKSIKVKSQFEVHENDFLISKRQIVHCACGVVPKELDRSIVSNEYAVLVPMNGNDVHFFDYFVQQPSVSLSFMQCSIGIVIEKMVFKLKDWLKEEFLFPEFEEQKKISQFLGRLDVIIDEQSKKVDSLNEYRKGLMQKLFPVMDEVV